MRGYYSCSLPLLWQTQDPSPSIVPLYPRWKHTTTLRTVIISIIHIISNWVIICIIYFLIIIAIICIYAVIFVLIHYNNYNYYTYYTTYTPFFNCRMVGIGWLSYRVRAWLQETRSLCHPHSKYSRKTSCSPRRRHRDHSVPPAQRVWWCTRRPQAGLRRRLQNVVRQLVGFGMVQVYVING